MTTVSDNLRKAVSRARKVPALLGLHPHTVVLQVDVYAGTVTGRGVRTTQSTPILESGTNPKVAWLNDKQTVAGNWKEGSIRVGPLTPEYDPSTHEGWSYDELSAELSLQKGGVAHLLVTGPRVPGGQKYQVKELRRTNFRWEFTAEPVT